MRRRRWTNAACAALLVLAAPLEAEPLPTDPPADGDLALMGTVPIYWGEADGIESLLLADSPGHWARPVIEAHYRLRPLDYLSAEALAGHTRLLLAQPRGLSAEENVALDGWVRGGGRVLLFADPLMTGETRFGLGDRRRPQDVALLSPILAHWGLELRFDAAQAQGRRMRDGVPLALPVDQPGELALAANGGECALMGEGIAADCRLGQGRALIVADAALFDGDGSDPAAIAALQGLLARIFGNRVPPSAPLLVEELNNGNL